MSRKRRSIAGLLIFLAVVLAFVYAQLSIGITAIRLDLQWIGESIYEVRALHGQWPSRVEDLDGTNVLQKVPRLRSMIQDAHYVVFWHQDLQANQRANADRVLAYDNHSRLSWFGKVWVCRGDLRVELMDIKGFSKPSGENQRP